MSERSAPHVLHLRVERRLPYEGLRFDERQRALDLLIEQLRSRSADRDARDAAAAEPKRFEEAGA